MSVDPHLPVDLTIVVLNWNGAGHLEDCLAAIQRQTVAAEVIVVDNASTDGSPEIVLQRFPDYRLLRTGSNLGFSAGMNAGLRAARGRFVWLLNNDVFIEPDSSARLLAEWSQMGDSVIGLLPRVLDGEGVPQTCGIRWTSSGRTVLLPTLDQDDDRPRRVFGDLFVAPSFRTHAFMAAGGFDEDFTIGAEDFEVAYRLNMTGHQLWACPGVTVRHGVSRSKARMPSSYVVRYELQRYFEIFLKYYETQNLIMYLPVAVARTWCVRGFRNLLEGREPRLTIARQFGGVIMGLFADWRRIGLQRKRWQSVRTNGDADIWALDGSAHNG